MNTCSLKKKFLCIKKHRCFSDNSITFKSTMFNPNMHVSSFSSPSLYAYAVVKQLFNPDNSACFQWTGQPLLAYVRL